MGEKIDNKYYVNNHVHLVVDYHPMVIDEVCGCDACFLVWRRSFSGLYNTMSTLVLRGVYI